MEYKQHGKQLLDELRAIELEADEIALDNLFGKNKSHVFLVDFSKLQKNKKVIILDSLILYRQTDTWYCCFTSQEEFAIFYHLVLRYQQDGSEMKTLDDIVQVVSNAHIEKLSLSMITHLRGIIPTTQVSVSLFYYSFGRADKCAAKNIYEVGAIIKNMEELPNKWVRTNTKLEALSFYRFENDSVVNAIQKLHYVKEM